MLTSLRVLTALLTTMYGTAAPPVREQQQWVLSALNVEQAWAVTKGKGVTVAVVDSGVDPKLKELQGRVFVAPDMNSAALDTKVKPGLHGTAMAALIAGSGADKGLVGVAPEASIMSLPLVIDEEPGDAVPPQEDERTGSDSALARALRYAANHNAKVVSMSIGSYGPDKAEREAVAYALERGVVLIAAVGNDGQTQYAQQNHTSYWSFPAGYPGVIGVSAVDKLGKRAPFSSDNLSVLVSAPGVDVPSVRLGGGYTGVTGTSASAALVAGVAALIKSKHPDMRPEQVAQALASSARGRPPAGYDDKVGFGVVDAGAALNAADALDGKARDVAVPDDRHFGAGEDSPVPSRPGPDPWRLALFGGGALLALAMFGVAVAILNQRRIR
ncbi:S8 family serine peptidase [Nonomuraea sp. NPDC050556]|uniref:S8 family serine peptidase n=1 Tax=Nonomuraea sp. NPDC050556 TaxID=3364369 RepID=UPI00378B4950